MRNNPEESCSRKIRRIQTHPELARTRPDYVVYIPSDGQEGIPDGGNENISVLEHRDGTLQAFWTQTSVEQAVDGRYVTARSSDGGLSWSAPEVIAGGNFDPKTGKNKINCGTAFRNRAGRTYLMLSLHPGVYDPAENGDCMILVSDDCGRTFSAPVLKERPRSERYDSSDPAVPPPFLPYLPPIRLRSGKYLGGCTKWYCCAKRKPAPHWTLSESACEVYVIDNLDESPSPEDLRIRWTAFGNTALTAPHYAKPDYEIGQEPSFVQYPDGRVLCVFRTAAGSPWYSLSEDEGDSWTPPEPLLYRQDGPPILHPLSPCPIFPLDKEGEYVLFIHAHSGNFGPWTFEDTTKNRRPLFALKGVFSPDDRQGIRFSEPMFFMDDDGVPLGHSIRRADLALYGCMTRLKGRHVLWYPDRKYFLCGKILDQETLNLLEFH